METEKRLIRADVTVEAFTKWLTSPYDGRMPADIVDEIPTVDAVEVDKINIRLHHILIDNEGVPEVKLQIGDRYFILHTDQVDVAEVVRCKDCFANGCCSVQIDLDMGDEGYCPKGRKET